MENESGKKHAPSRKQGRVFALMVTALVVSTGLALRSILVDGLGAWWFQLGHVDVAIGGMCLWALFVWRFAGPRYARLRIAVGLLLSLVMVLDLAFWFRLQYRPAGSATQFARPIQSFLILLMFFAMFFRRNPAG